MKMMMKAHTLYQWSALASEMNGGVLDIQADDAKRNDEVCMEDVRDA